MRGENGIYYIPQLAIRGHTPVGHPWTRKVNYLGVRWFENQKFSSQSEIKIPARSARALLLPDHGNRRFPYDPEVLGL